MTLHRHAQVLEVLTLSVLSRLGEGWLALMLAIAAATLGTWLGLCLIYDFVYWYLEKKGGG